jgi:TRAP-type mannitol/chloroaromatic compound transport system permease small subunit
MAEDEGGKSSIIDRLSVATGHAAAWLTLLMVVATFVIVVLRYAFDYGVIWLQESVTWMHAAVFMLGAAYTLQRDGHVRVDIFYRKMTEQRKALVDLFGVICFILPLCVFFIVEAADYVVSSWSIREVSRDAGGLPFPFVPLLKSALIVMPVAVLLQGVSMALKSISTLRGR